MPSIYQLQAPLLAMRSARVDSPVSNHKSYADDKKFFADHPKRRMHIREEVSGEFDLEMPTAEWLQTPRLWNLVVQVAKDVHSVTPIYRGSRFWDLTLRDDDAVAFVLVEMARQEGMNLAEFLSFGERVKAKNRAFIERSNPGKNVH